MGTLIQDIRFAIRVFAKSPLFTLAAVLTLALGIGANTAMFSCMNAMLLHPVSFEGLDRLVMLWERLPGSGFHRGSLAPAEFQEWKARSRSFESLAAFAWWNANLGGSGADGSTPPEQVEGFEISPELFPLLRVSPAMGRGFLPEESQPGRNQVVVLSHELWQRRFQGDPAIVGRAIRVNGESFTVVGVMPAHFGFPFQSALWSPLSFTAEMARNRQSRYLTLVARLAAGVTASRAQGEMSTIARQLEREWPQSNAGRDAMVVPLLVGVVDEVSPTFILLLMGTVAFVLLIVCANVAGLMLARAASRSREIAIRMAMGASRAQLVRQLLTESVALALAGGGLGVLVAGWMVDLMVQSVPLDVRRYIPGFENMRLDPGALGFTLVVAVATGLVFGLAPTLQASRPDLRRALSEGGRGARGAGGHRARRLLVVAEIAISLLLLVGAGLLVRGFRHMADTGGSFDPRGVLAFDVSLPRAKYTTPPAIAAFYDRSLEHIARLPGVESVGMGYVLPWLGSTSLLALAVEGRPAPRVGDEPLTAYRVVGGDFFRTLRIARTAGRNFAPSDDSSAAQVALVNRTLARRLASSGGAIGLRIRIPSFGTAAPWLTVVGVIDDVKNDPFDRDPQPITYVPFAQHPTPSMQVAVRTTGNPSAMVGAVRSQIQAVDPDQPIYQARPLEQRMADHVSGVRVATVMMGIFGTLALLLAAIGIYGLVAHSVAERTHEMGVRMALGASRGDLLRLVVGQGMRLALVGLAFGIPASYGLLRLLSHFLPAVIIAEPFAFVTLPALLLAVVLLASYLPARGATRVDPMIALRCE